jgi:hypothetical protein
MPVTEARVQAASEAFHQQDGCNTTSQHHLVQHHLQHHLQHI